MSKIIDMHVHTMHSNSLDAPINTVYDLLKKYKEKKIDGVAICEHNTLSSFPFIKKYLSEKAPGMIVIRGIEISSLEGHILGYGISEEIPNGLSAQETIDRINKQGGLAVIPHPLSPFSGVRSNFDKLTRYAGVEELNGVAFDLFDYFTKRKIKNLNCAKIGGSDSHTPWTIGTTYTEFPDEAVDEDSVLKCIRKRQTTPRRKFYRTLLNFIYDWFGFRIISAPQRLKNIIKYRSFKV